MKLRELLLKYDKNAIMKQVIRSAKISPKSYITITEHEKGYKIEPTFLFYRISNASRTSMIITKDLAVVEEYNDCGCLEFYKNKKCIHISALYAIALMILDRELFEKAYKEYEQMKQIAIHQEILSRLSQELKTSNSYFNQIHIIPCIEQKGKAYDLSLKIGFDKDYVVKSIYQFVNQIENHIEYSYGQKLSFVHSYESLDDVSKEFYAFLRNISNESTEKSIEIRKSHLLRLLEIYQGEIIHFKSEKEIKSSPRKIIKTNDVNIILNDEKLYISNPNDSKEFISGINHAYFIDNEYIYTYSYKSRMEEKIIDCLFRVDGALSISANSVDFISELLPVIKNTIRVDDSFYVKYPIPEIKVDSFISYENTNIYLDYKINCLKEDENSPYIQQLLEGYFQVIESFGFAKNSMNRYNICNIENQYKFLTAELSTIKAFGDVLFDESMKNVNAKKTSKTNINISFNVGLLDFKFENSNLTLEEIQAMLIGYHQKKKFIKLKDNTILEINDEAAKEIDNFLEDFNISIKDLTKPVSKPMNYLLKLIDAHDNNVSLDDKIISMIETIQSFKTSKYVPTKQFKDVLRSYQLEGFKWLKTLTSFGFGGILADDMGLGKTLEIISFLASDAKEMPSLIVCPMSLIYNWENECIKWKIDCPVKLIIGSAEEREIIINNISSKQKALYITSYDSLRRDVSLYSTKFRFVIADEAQYIKNQFAQKSEAIKSINSEINFALTGTPIENGLADLWSIFDYLMPGYLSNYTHFKSRYESLILNDDDEALDLLKKRVSPFILRRTKKDVLKDLPDKIEDYYYCKMDSKQREIYDAYVEMLKDDINQGGNNILALLTRLRQICITPQLIYQEAFENTKINMAVDLIKASIDSGHRILVFSQFSQSFPILSKELEKMNIKNFILDGSTKAKTRMEMVEEFNSNEDIKVFIISLKAGGTGLNLVGADMVIHLDPWWNSSAESQATDRAYRIGQTKNVYVVKLICKDTIEEKVVKLQELKKELAESIVLSDNDKQFKLMKQDILELLD